MRRDPTEFRQRFVAWKDGENYWDTRGEDILPGYYGGKTGFYNTHRDKWKLFLISKGVDAEQANRLSTYFAALDSLESGNGTSSAARQKNNFGGMLRGGKNISYNTVQDYMNDKWNMMNKRFSRALNAKTVQEYATLINDPKYAGKGYLYAVADGYNQKNPLDRAWVARQILHMNNYTKAMMGIAGQKGFVARPVPKAPVVSKQTPAELSNFILPITETLLQNEFPITLPEPPVTTTQTPIQAVLQTQVPEYIQKPLISEKVPVLGNDYWDSFFNNSSLDLLQSLMQQLMTSHKHGKNILPRHADGKTPGDDIVYETLNTEDGTTYRVKPSAFGARELNVTTPEVVVTARDPRKYSSAFDGNQEYLDDLVGFVPVAGDVNDAINAGIAAHNGDYLQAGILGAGLFLPNVLEKPLRTAGKILMPKFAKYLKHGGELKQLRRELDEMFRQVNELSQLLRSFEEGLPHFPSSGSILLPEDLQREMASVNYDRYFFRDPYATEQEIRRNIELLRNDPIAGEFTHWLRGGSERPKKNLKLPRLDSSKGDIRHLAYFDMSPRQAVAKMESDFLNLPSLRYFALVHDGDVSTDSYPLALSAMYKHSTAGDILPVFTEDGNHAMQRLNGLGNVKGTAAVDRINKKLSKIENIINKQVPKAYLTENGSIMVPSFLFKKYKHGKNPIHINPANRGKFNALKKRTGKTTELLTHSKNPLTRKRAIFAQNAAKWRRK